VFLRLRISTAQQAFLNDEATRRCVPASQIVRGLLNQAIDERAKEVRKRETRATAKTGDKRQVPLAFPTEEAPPAAPYDVPESETDHP